MKLINADKLIYQSHAQHLEPYINKKDIDNAPTVEMSEDCVKRNDVLDLLQMKYSGKELYKAIYELPSVRPQPKIGYWIAMSEGFTPYECSECGGVEFKKSKYCPNCGADMRGVRANDD